MSQVQQWTYYGRLDDAARPVEPLLSTVLSLGAALPRHNPRILPSIMAGVVSKLSYLAAAPPAASAVPAWAVRQAVHPVCAGERGRTVAAWCRLQRRTRRGRSR